MCGIAGILSLGKNTENLQERVLRMRSFLSHRGPDDVGIYSDGGIALAHARLSIIDLAGGQQPLHNEDKTIYLVANGEIYNYKLLRKKLLSQGHKLLTQSDCEVIVHLYEDEGESCVRHLKGMFAFALWDARQRKLLLVRDRFGIKPLYAATLENHFCFASELTSIVQSGLIKKEVDPQALYAYLTFSYVPGPKSILKNIHKVQPAERLIIQNNSIKKDIYWQPREVYVPRKKSEAIAELASLLEKSVCSHLVSDVPVAAFLSGGVDSSGIVAMAKRHTDIETFCVSFTDSEIDESHIARQVANHLKTRHHEVSIKVDPAKLLTEAVNYMDEPFADSSALPTFAVCQAARNIAKVVLSGDGGDEVFGGYTGRYRVAALKAVFPMPEILASGLRQLPPWRSGRRRSSPEMLDLAALAEEDRYVLERQITVASDRADLFGQSHTDAYERELRDIAARPHANFNFKHPVHRALWMDLMTSLPDDMLTKVDRMSMAHGLEVRVPFLDHRLVEFSLSLPPNWLVSPLPVEGKRILREVVNPLLPNGILNRPKRGFVVPLNNWIEEHFFHIFDDVCLSTNSFLTGLLDHRAILNLREKPLKEKPRHDLYALLVLELWLRRIFE